MMRLFFTACVVASFVCGRLSLLTAAETPTAAPADPSPMDPAQVEFFETRIRPVLVDKCLDCHSGAPEDVQGKLWLDSAAGWKRGGQSGPAIVPGRPEASLLLHAMRGTEKNLAMPPDEKLSAAILADFETWIRNGAIDPRDGAPPVVARSKTLTERERWAFSPPVKPALPTVHQEDWARQPLDRFILAPLEAAQLTPARSATPEHLVRRLTYDLTGLPPTSAEVRAFVEHASQDQQQAVVKLVDKLLERPAYGEKWARYWLDCVRYADSLDSRGSGGDGDIRDAWRYRDWVVQSFNRDRPYNEFVREQIAGDLLAAQNWDADRVVATSVYAIGHWGNGDSDKQKVYTDIVDDQIDLTTRTFLGLTVACARCHDHKFDPISTADYYGLAGFFFSSHIIERFAAPTAGEGLMRINLLSPEERAQRDDLNRQIAAIDAQLGQVLIPLSKRVDQPRGFADGVVWTQPNVDNPSVVINRSQEAKPFVTSVLPPRGVSIHPGPKEPVSVVWKSPLSGEVQLSFALKDIDGGCGDGFRWRLESPAQQLVSGQVANGGEVARQQIMVTVVAGELLRLIVEPGETYFCDSTAVELTIEAGNQSWSLVETLLNNDLAQNAETSPFLVCAGSAGTFLDTLPNKDELLAESDRLKGRLPENRFTQGLQDGGVPGSNYAGFQDAPIHVRGSYDRLAQVQPRGVPEVFQTSLGPIEGSGRLALADWVASSGNPLTARVFVNRIWQHHFGRGIVATPNNFGHLGTPPSHPELLDWLAVTFMENGWSLKELHRMICTSATYQQASTGDPQTMEGDPDNLLFGRQSRRKLTAEELRDSLLSVTGALDSTLGGPAFADLATPRRTLYLTTIRSNRSTYQLLFDGADPTTIVEQRNDSLVAPQALWLLNRPFVLEQAKAMANRFRPEENSGITLALRRLIEHIYGREATMEELELLQSFLAQHDHSDRAWQQLCHLLLCSNEFMFVD